MSGTGDHVSVSLSSPSHAASVPWTSAHPGGGDDPVAIAVAPGPPSMARVTSTGGAPRTATIARQLSMGQATLFRGGVQEQFYCQVCMCNYPATDAFTLTNCGHRFCATCMRSLVQTNVNEAQVFIRCSYNPEDDPNAAPSTAGGAGGGEAVGGLRRSLRTLSGFPSPPRPTASVMSANPAVVAGAGGAAAAANPAPPAGAVAAAVAGTCGSLIAEADILRAIASDPDLLDRYRRFKATANNPNTRHCPYTGCDGMQVGTASEPRMVCVKCGREYCFTHSNAHVGKTCEVYTKEQMRDTKLAEDAMANSRDIRRCPKCRVPISKISGCNHMRCRECHQDFCWLCGKAIQGGTLPTHYAWWNLAGCPNRQMSEGPRTCRQTVLHGCGTVLAFVLLGPLALLLTVASFILCGCCLIPICLSDDDGPCTFFSTVTMLWMMVLSVVIGSLLSLPFVVLVGVLAIICCPCVFLVIYMAKDDE